MSLTDNHKRRALLQLGIDQVKRIERAKTQRTSKPSPTLGASNVHYLAQQRVVGEVQPLRLQQQTLSSLVTASVPSLQIPRRKEPSKLEKVMKTTILSRLRSDKTPLKQPMSPARLIRPLTILPKAGEVGLPLFKLPHQTLSGKDVPTSKPITLLDAQNLTKPTEALMSSPHPPSLRKLGPLSPLTDVDDQSSAVSQLATKLSDKDALPFNIKPTPEDEKPQWKSEQVDVLKPTDQKVEQPIFEKVKRVPHVDSPAETTIDTSEMSSPPKVEKAPAQEDWIAARHEELARRQKMEMEAAAEAEERTRKRKFNMAVAAWVASRPATEVQRPPIRQEPLIPQLEALRKGVGDWVQSLAKFDALIRHKSNTTDDTIAVMSGTFIAGPVLQAAPLDALPQILATLENRFQQRHLSSSKGIKRVLFVARAKCLIRQREGSKLAQTIFSATDDMRHGLPRLTAVSCIQTISRHSGVQGSNLAEEVIQSLRDSGTRERHWAFDIAFLLGRASTLAETTPERKKLVEHANKLESDIRKHFTVPHRWYIQRLMIIFGLLRRFGSVTKLYNEMKSLSLTDEAMAGTLLRFTAVSNHLKILHTLQHEEKLDIHSSYCIKGILDSCLSQGDPQAAISHYTSFRSEKASSDFPHSILAPLLSTVKFGLASPTVDRGLISSALDDALVIAQDRFGQDFPGGVRSKVYEALGALMRHEDLLKLDDSLSNIPSEEYFVTSAANEALQVARIAHGLSPKPLPVMPSRSSSKAEGKKEDLLSSRVSKEGETFADDDDLVSPQEEDSSSSLPSMDGMMKLAKRRDWERALAIVEQIPLNMKPNLELQLRFNAALSAAVECSSALEQILEDMDKRKIPKNATTYNTQLSCALQSPTKPNPSELVTMLDQIPRKTRDTNSYAMVLASLGKQPESSWDTILRLCNEMRELSLIPRPHSFGMLVEASYHASWQTALTALCECQSAHGKGSVSQRMFDRVSLSLKDANKHIQLKKLQTLAAQSTKKRRKSKKN